MVQDVKANCDGTCKKMAALKTRKPPPKLIRTFKVMEQVQIDLMDYFSKYCWLVSLTSKTSAVVSKALQNTFTQYGCPEKLQSDNGGEFVSHVVEELCSSLKIRIIHGRPYHPQSQGQVERLNRGTVYSLAISFARDCLQFEQQLAQCTLCYSF